MQIQRSQLAVGAFHLIHIGAIRHRQGMERHMGQIHSPKPLHPGHTGGLGELSIADQLEQPMEVLNTGQVRHASTRGNQHLAQIHQFPGRQLTIRTFRQLRQIGSELGIGEVFFVDGHHPVTDQLVHLTPSQFPCLAAAVVGVPDGRGALVKHHPAVHKIAARHHGSSVRLQLRQRREGAVLGHNVHIAQLMELVHLGILAQIHGIDVRIDQGEVLQQRIAGEIQPLRRHTIDHQPLQLREIGQPRQVCSPDIFADIHFRDGGAFHLRQHAVLTAGQGLQIRPERAVGEVFLVNGDLGLLPVQGKLRERTIIKAGLADDTPVISGVVGIGNGVRALVIDDLAIPDAAALQIRHSVQIQAQLFQGCAVLHIAAVAADIHLIEQIHPAQIQCSQLAVGAKHHRHTGTIRQRQGMERCMSKFHSPQPLHPGQMGLLGERSIAGQDLQTMEVLNTGQIRHASTRANHHLPQIHQLPGRQLAVRTFRQLRQIGTELGIGEMFFVDGNHLVTDQLVHPGLVHFPCLAAAVVGVSDGRGALVKHHPAVHKIAARHHGSSVRIQPRQRSEGAVLGHNVHIAHLQEALHLGILTQIQGIDVRVPHEEFLQQRIAGEIQPLHRHIIDHQRPQLREIGQPRQIGNAV